MSNPDQSATLRRFIQVGELLEQAFSDPMPTPDYLVHECELAEHALLQACARSGSTADAALAKLFAVTYRRS